MHTPNHRRVNRNRLILNLLSRFPKSFLVNVLLVTLTRTSTPCTTQVSLSEMFSDSTGRRLRTGLMGEDLRGRTLSVPNFRQVRGLKDSIESSPLRQSTLASLQGRRASLPQLAARPTSLQQCGQGSRGCSAKRSYRPCPTRFVSQQNNS
jgi:hypothetical protein